MPQFEKDVSLVIDSRHWVLEVSTNGADGTVVEAVTDANHPPSTIRRAHTLLQLALEMAVDDGRLARSPCRRIALPRIEQSEKPFLSIDEVEHLADTIKPPTGYLPSPAPTPGSDPAKSQPCAPTGSTSHAASSEWRSRSRHPQHAAR
jgi:hypothetical protein